MQLETERRTTPRLHATRDGLTGQVTAIPSDERTAHSEFTRKFIDGLQSKTALELHLASAIAQDTWRLNRVRAIENNIFALGASDPECLVDTHPKAEAALNQARVCAKEIETLQALSLYESRITRNLHANIRALKELQAERLAEHEQALEEAAVLARFNESKGLPAVTHPLTTPRGFVFSGEQFTAAVARKRALMEASQKQNRSLNRAAA